MTLIWRCDRVGSGAGPGNGAGKIYQGAWAGLTQPDTG